MRRIFYVRFTGERRDKPLPGLGVGIARVGERVGAGVGGGGGCGWVLRALIRSRRTSFAKSTRPKIGRRGLKARANGAERGHTGPILSPIVPFLGMICLPGCKTRLFGPKTGRMGLGFC